MSQAPALLFPLQGFARGPGPRVLLVCFYDPAGIPTVIETVAFLQRASRLAVTVLNLFEHRLDEGPLKLHPWLNLDAFDAVVIHNTVSYDADNLRRLDERLPRRLRDFRGVKVLMKQDENHRFREVAAWVGDTGIDVLFTCLPPEAVPLVYPPAVAGTPRVERMLTGYLTPTLRERPWPQGDRPVDIGYRGSIQPLSFGLLALEKRKIGADVAAALAGSGLSLDISSRWEDRLGGEAWLDFLSGCKATLGAESGASIFDLAGDLEQRCRELEARHARIQDEMSRAAAIVAGLADLENNVRYHQVSPRHFEAAACGTLQLLYPGHYSGIFQPWRHYVPLERDLSNLDEAVAVLRDEPRREAIVRAARDEIVADRRYWIESFVARMDDCIEETLRQREPAPSAHLQVLCLSAGALPSAPALPLGAVLHRLTLSPSAQPGAGGGVHLAVAADGGSPHWLARLGIGAIASAPASLLLAAGRLAQLPEHDFCEATGAPPGPRAEAFRQRLGEFDRQVCAFVDHALRMRGLDLLVAADLPSLAAAVLLSPVLGVPVARLNSDLPTASSAELACERQYWSQLAAQLRDEVPAAAADGLTIDAQLLGHARNKGRQSFTLADETARRPLRPGAPVALGTRDRLRLGAYALARTAWRVLPAAAQARLKPAARRWMVKLF